MAKKKQDPPKKKADPPKRQDPPRKPNPPKKPDPPKKGPDRKPDKKKDNRQDKRDDKNKKNKDKSPRKKRRAGKPTSNGRGDRTPAGTDQGDESSPSPQPPATEEGETPEPPDNRVVLAADPDLLLRKVENAPIELIEEMLFQSIGSLELITIMRDYSFDGIPLFYQAIQNLEEINQEYNPQKVTSPAFNFANWRQLHGIEDTSHIQYTNPDSPGAVRLEILPGQINIVVSLPDIGENQLIEVAVSYSPEGVVYEPTMSGDMDYDGGHAEADLFGVLLDGGDSDSPVTEIISCGDSYSYYAMIDGGESLSNFLGSVDGGDSLGYNIDRTLIGRGA